MDKGALVQRGKLNPNKGNEPYFDKMNEKFKAPKSEFKLEAFLEMITPRNHIKRSSVIDFITRKKNAHLKREDYDQAAAWEHWLSELQIKSFESNEDKQFTIDFYDWCAGVGKEGDHQKTPWYRIRTKDKEVEAYLHSLFDAKYEFMNAIQMLVVKAKLSGLQGINEYVRGGPGCAPVPGRDPGLIELRLIF